MKNIFLFVSLAIITVSISSCTGPTGPDGKDGSAYNMITSSDGSLLVNSNGTLISGDFGSFGNGSTYNVYYLTSPDKYYADFKCEIYSNGYYYTEHWTGYYTISVNPGSAGGSGKPFWQQGDAGKDGADRYYKLDCTFDSPGMNVEVENYYWKRGQSAITDTAVVGKVYTRDYSDDKYNIHIECQLKSKTVTKAK
jgi:hypothetical protein